MFQINIIILIYINKFFLFDRKKKSHLMYYFFLQILLKIRQTEFSYDLSPVNSVFLIEQIKTCFLVFSYKNTGVRANLYLSYRLLDNNTNMQQDILIYSSNNVDYNINNYIEKAELVAYYIKTKKLNSINLKVITYPGSTFTEEFIIKYPNIWKILFESKNTFRMSINGIANILLSIPLERGYVICFFGRGNCNVAHIEVLDTELLYTTSKYYMFNTFYFLITCKLN